MIKFFKLSLTPVIVVAFTISALSLSLKSAFAKPPADALRYAEGLSLVFQSIATEITPSVVGIVARERMEDEAEESDNSKTPSGDPLEEMLKRFFKGRPGGQQPLVGMGTGVIIDSKGHIITNNHVIGDSDVVEVTLHNERKVDALVVGADPLSDLAVVRVTSSDITPATLGSSKDLRIGEWVVAVGNPFGFQNSITAGIVSAKGRSISRGYQYEDFIQTDAAINPGNSGGPLVNLRGEVVGINTAILSRSGGYMGLGFAIPSAMVKTISKSLIENGKVVRGWLGVHIQELTAELSTSFQYPSTAGALVSKIQDGSPAEDAGIEEGDIITAIGSTKIKSIDELRNFVAQITPNEVAPLAVFREGEQITIKVKIGELPTNPGTPSKPAKKDEAKVQSLGLKVQTLTPELAETIGASADKGVVVTFLEPGGYAQRATLREGDIVLSVDGKDVGTVEEFEALVGSKNIKKGVRLLIETKGKQRFLSIRRR